MRQTLAIKADRWIRQMALEHGMIEPFVDSQVRAGVVSFGLSSYGYDIRVADEFKVFTNINNTVIDPKNFDPRSFVDIRADVCIVPPNSFALARTIEYFRIPRDVLTVCLGKSTYARCGIIVNVTPVRAGVGRVRDARDLEHDAAAGKDLRQRGHRAGAVLPERRAVRAVVRGQEGQVPEAAGGDAAEDLTPTRQTGRAEPADLGTPELQVPLDLDQHFLCLPRIEMSTTLRRSSRLRVDLNRQRAVPFRLVDQAGGRIDDR